MTMMMVFPGCKSIAQTDRARPKSLVKNDEAPPHELTIEWEQDVLESARNDENTAHSKSEGVGFCVQTNALPLGPARWI